MFCVLFFFSLFFLLNLLGSFFLRTLFFRWFFLAVITAFSATTVVGPAFSSASAPLRRFHEFAVGESHVDCFFPPLLVDCNAEGHLLVFSESSEALCFDLGLVTEHVFFRVVVALDEAEASLAVEPLHDSCDSRIFFCVVLSHDVFLWVMDRKS